MVDEKANWAKRMAMVKELLGKFGPGAAVPLGTREGDNDLPRASLPAPPMGPLGELPCKFNCGVKCASFLELVHHHETCQGSSNGLSDLNDPNEDSASLAGTDDGDLNHSNSR